MKRTEWEKLADDVRVLHAAVFLNEGFNRLTPRAGRLLDRMNRRARKLAPWPDPKPRGARNG